MDEEVEEAELDNMDDIDVEKELVTINEDPNCLNSTVCAHSHSMLIATIFNAWLQPSTA
jgi:hypothetical protein